MRYSTGEHSMLKWIPSNCIIRSISLQIVLISITFILAGLLLQSTRYVVGELDLPQPSDSAPNETDTPDDCEACELLVKSFDLGLERTIRGKHEGGDTYWEEKNLKSYADSEIRLVEIQEDLCNELKRGKAQCFKIVEESETDIETWWFDQRKKNVRLRDYLCINKLKKCCPEGKFGPTCQDCPSNCNKQGKCDGSGTRAGTGECNCNPGYRGAECDKCAEDYYKWRTGEEDEFACLKCHKACAGGCNGPTSVNCTECRAGYSRDPVTNLCLDINECELSADGMPAEAAKRTCPDGTYCVNTDGHYKCSNCHFVCSTCLGYGPNKCISCAPDYEMDRETHICTHFSKLGISEDSSEASREFHVPFKRAGENLLFTLYRISFFPALAGLLWQLYNNWRAGQPLREFRAIIRDIITIVFAVTIFFRPGIFLNGYVFSEVR